MWHPRLQDAGARDSVPLVQCYSASVALSPPWDSASALTLAEVSLLELHE